MVLQIHASTSPPRLSTAPAQVALSSGLIFSRLSDLAQQDLLRARASSASRTRSPCRSARPRGSRAGQAPRCAIEPTPPVAPLTITGPFAGLQAVVLHAHDARCPRCSPRCRRPSPPRATCPAAASSASRRARARTARSRRGATRRVSKPMAEHRVALGELRVAGRHHRAGQVDAADAARPAQDPALAGGRERVLVVHVGVRDAHHDVARVELVERACRRTRRGSSCRPRCSL